MEVETVLFIWAGIIILYTVSGAIVLGVDFLFNSVWAFIIWTAFCFIVIGYIDERRLEN